MNFKIWNTVQKCFYTQEHKHTFCITLEGKVACWDESQGWDDSFTEHYVPLRSTGLFDSLEQEIYENDIILFSGTETETILVEWDNYGYWNISQQNLKYIRIIGNIYENTLDGTVTTFKE